MTLPRRLCNTSGALPARGVLVKRRYQVPVFQFSGTLGTKFKGTMTFKYDPANPDALICSAQGDSFNGKATVTKDKFQWTEGWMNPGYTHDPNETVDLTRGFKREG